MEFIKPEVVSVLRMTLSNGESCTAGSRTHKINTSHIFDPNKKISLVEVVINKGEYAIDQINFYSGRELLVQVGLGDDRIYGQRPRWEEFEIAADEQLIGAEFYHGDH